MVNFLVFFEIINFCFVGDICDQVDDVDAIHSPGLEKFSV